MYNIVFANQKGGVAKTTSALAVGLGLQRMGKRVLFCDADPQCNLSRVLGADDQSATMYDVLTSNSTAAAAIQDTAKAHIIAADERLADRTVYNARNIESRLRDALRPLAGRYDYCVIDTPPTESPLTKCALIAGSGVIIPVRADRFSITGTDAFYDTVLEIREKQNPSLEVLGLIVGNFDGRTNINRQVLETLKQQAEGLDTVVLGVVRRTIAAEMWQYTADPYGTGSTAADDYADITRAILAATERS